MNPNQPMNAEHPKEMISAYLDGQLEALERALVFEHLRACAACRQLLSDFRALAAAARREGAPPVPADLAERIGRRIGAGPEERFTRRWRLVAGARLPLATAAAVLVLSSLWIVWRGRLSGERPAGPQPAAAPAPTLAPALAQAPSPSPVPVPSAPPAPPVEPGSVEPEIARNLDTLGYAGGRQDAGSREHAGSRAEGGPSRSIGPVAAGPPPPAPLPMKAAPRVKEAAPTGERVAQAQQSQEEKKAATLSRETIPAPEENPDVVDAATARAQEETAARALAPGVAGAAMTPATAGTTLVFVMAEGRVSILPDAQIVLVSGDYLCTLRAGGPEEDETLADLRALASGWSRPAGIAKAPGAAAESGSPTGALPGELVIPAPPGSGPLPPDLAAQMHRRVRTLVRERLLARAEAQCGPAPPALRRIR